MAVEARPSDLLTRANVFIGMPFIEFSPALTGGGYGAYRQLGIVDSAALQKTLETIQLIDSRSGVQVVDREEISSLQIGMQLSMFKFDPENLQLFLGAPTLTTVSSGSVAVTNEQFTVQPTDRFGYLQHGRIAATALTGIDPMPVVNEAVGTGNGVLGGTTGDFALDWPVKVIGDVTAFTVGGVNEFANVVSGTTPAAGQIAIAVGAAANSGQITFGASKIPAAGAAIVASYDPSFVTGDFALNTDYVLDPYGGGIRFLLNTRVRTNQPLEIDYSYTNVTRQDMNPFTQLTFQGRARIKQLTDLGINFIWPIPSVSIRITDDDFEWSNDGFAAGNLFMRINSVGGTAPYGTWQSYPETPTSP